MVECTFELNGKPMSLLKMGAIHLPAFSGLGGHVKIDESIYALPMSVQFHPEPTTFSIASLAADWALCATC